MIRKSEKILVLGAGKMIEGILTGLQKKMDLSEVLIFSPSGLSAQKLAKKLGAKWAQDIQQTDPDMILVGCKPQQIRELKRLIGDKFSEVPAMSILAAISEKTQREILGLSKLIRIMPNLAVAFNEGVSLVSSSSAPEFLPKIQEMFSHLGHVEMVSEKELEDLTLLTGSSAAFFYEFAHYLAESFGSLDPERREGLIRKVLMGASSTLKNSHEGLEELIGNVTSKGGVTIAVLEEFRRQGLDESVKAGVAKGHERARNLSSSILQS